MLADDHAAVRLGMRMVVESAPGFTVVGEAENGATAISMARAQRPDLVLMDLRMPVMDGVAATGRIVAEALSKVLVLTTFDHDEYLFGALAAGARGFLLKSASPQSIIAAMDAVLGGDQVLAPEVTAKIVHAALGAAPAPAPQFPGIDPRTVLTERELQVLRELGAGHTNHLIGRNPGIGETTVKTHVSRLMGKLGVASRVQAALAAHRAFAEARATGPPPTNHRLAASHAVGVRERMPHHGAPAESGRSRAPATRGTGDFRSGGE
ncbi:DNA-binding response regulator [Arthrobacter sp. AQ5-05]|nr:DNA-binding response regulator [Arthrobacter sp. AQ5-05]